tara:strand:- start:1318 stop:2082 length:765 start_codon:yes stop_codon:yes gene_type:complete
MAEEKRQFPTEMITLPSKGYLYPDDNPLSSGEVEVKYMTAREEDILTSQNLIQKGIVLDKLLESLIVSNINQDDILLGDKNAILLAARVLAYGKEYEFEYIDTDGETRSNSVDLTSFESKEVDFKKFTKGVNEHDFQLPTSKKVVTFKLVTQGDEKAVESQLKALSKISPDYVPEITTRLKQQIVAIDGNRETSVINDFVDNQLLSRDSLDFRKYLQEISPDVKMTCEVRMIDGTDEEMTVPVTARFFWPDAGI